MRERLEFMWQMFFSVVVALIILIVLFGIWVGPWSIPKCPVCRDRGEFVERVYLNTHDCDTYFSCKNGHMYYRHTHYAGGRYSISIHEGMPTSMMD